MAHRHIQMVCAGQVLSEAWNWYVPARLTDEMRARLRGFRLWVRSVVPAPTAPGARLLNAEGAKTPEAPAGRVRHG